MPFRTAISSPPAASENLAIPLDGRNVPAWLMSLIVHALLAIMLALLVRSTPRAPREEPARQVGIVLANVDQRQQQTFYEDASRTTADADTSASSTATSADSASSTADALPSSAAAQSLKVPDIDLPGSALPHGDVDDVLVTRMNLDGGGRQPILPGLGDEAIFAEEAERRAAEQARGNPTRVSLFGSAAAEGRSFVFAIDRSKSMGGSGLNAMAAVRDELAAALAKLSPNHRFQVIAYHHNIVYYRTPRLIPATPENTADVPAFIDRLAALGGTVHETALRASLAMEPDVVFLLTDGGDPYLNDIQLKNIRKLAEGRTTIHTIQFGFSPAPPPDGFMQRLAAENGGGFAYVNMSVANRKRAD